MAKVLLVEDDNNLREIYQARLMAEGYTIVAAQNGEEALVVAKQDKPDLIISDVMMPRISGFEMLDILRNTDELKNTKVIMLTALGQAEDESRAGNLGADKYLVKSQVTLEDIVNAAKELLGETGADTSATAAATETATPVPAEPLATPMAEAPVIPEPAATPDETAVPASVVPQPDTTVAVPPAPASPTPPGVTTVSMPPVPATDTTQAADPVSADAATTPASTTPIAAGPASQSLEEEEAGMQAQIDNFAKQPADAAVTADASNDQALAEAVEELNASTEPTTSSGAAPAETAPATAPGTEPTVPTPAEATPPKPAVGGTKVIQPLSNSISSPGPDLNELLAKEATKDQSATTPASPAAAPVPAAGTPAPAAPPAAAPPSSTGVDPNTIAL